MYIQYNSYYSSDRDYVYPIQKLLAQIEIMYIQYNSYELRSRLCLSNTKVTSSDRDYVYPIQKLLAQKSELSCYQSPDQALTSILS